MVLGLGLSAFAFLVVPAILGGKNLAAQSGALQASKPAQQQHATVEHGQSRRPAAAHARAVWGRGRPVPEEMAAPPLAPPVPISPANQPPNQAKVSWDSHALEIEASNSSLDQILHQVAADTGAKLEGFTEDQRVFGTYGPGPAYDVLSKLLDGSGYNVLIIGRRDADAPLEVVLSVRTPAAPQTAAHNRNRSNPEDDDAAVPPPELPPSPPMQTPFGNGDSGSPESPEQIMQDILDRQHKIDQQQKQDRQNELQSAITENG